MSQVLLWFELVMLLQILIYEIRTAVMLEFGRLLKILAMVLNCSRVSEEKGNFALDLVAWDDYKQLLECWWTLTSRRDLVTRCWSHWSCIESHTREWINTEICRSLIFRNNQSVWSISKLFCWREFEYKWKQRITLHAYIPFDFAIRWNWFSVILFDNMPSMYLL